LGLGSGGFGQPSGVFSKRQIDTERYNRTGGKILGAQPRTISACLILSEISLIPAKRTL
jgi:hypothetical protein